MSVCWVGAVSATLAALLLVVLERKEAEERENQVPSEHVAAACACVGSHRCLVVLERKAAEERERARCPSE